MKKKVLLSLVTSFLITSSLLAQVPAYVPTNGLVGYWPFNGNANDESGNNLPINNYFVQFSNDSQRGMVANFNGNSWLESDTSLFQTQTPITIQFWAKSSNNYSMDIIGQACGNDCGDDIRVQLNAAQCNSTGLSFKSPAFFATAPAQTDNNQWHLYTLIMGNNNNFSYSNFQFFIDGLFIAIGPAQCSHNWGGWAYNPNPSYHFSIGKGGPLGYYFNGLLDDITIYNRALTPEEIIALYTGTTSTPIAGCTITSACNYNAAATQDDGSCTFPTQTYLNCDGSCINDANSNGICDEVETNLPSYLPTNGLVGYWPFNGNADDESGNGNHGTVNGATLTTDRNGNANSAYSFDGINDFIESQNSVDITNNSPRTISLFFNVSNFGTGWSTLLNFGTPCPNSGTSNSLQIDSISNPISSTRLIFKGNGSSDDVYYVPLLNNIWYNFIWTFDGAISHIYFNGINVTNTPFELNTELTSVKFGFDYTSLNCEEFHHAFNKAFNGKIDDIAIFNRALTEEEISALYNGTTNNNSGNNNNSALTTVPAGISYQAVARNAQGTALANTAIQVKFTLITDSLSGTSEYVETHSLSTNSMGLFTTAFGTGTAVTGTWAGINWTHSNKYLKVELDAGNGFVDLGTQQLLSSPFAIRAQSAATIENGDLPIFADNAAAIAGGLTVGKLYRTATGELKVVY